MNGAQAAEILGCSEATVSRIRSGDRRPSLPLMKEIQRLLSWGVNEQQAAIERGTYHVEFTYKMDVRRVRRRHRRGRAAC